MNSFTNVYQIVTRVYKSYFYKQLTERQEVRM